MIRSSRAIRFDGNGYSEEWRAEAARRGLDCETCAPRVFDRYLDPSSVEMFARMGVRLEGGARSPNRSEVGNLVPKRFRSKVACWAT